MNSFYHNLIGFGKSIFSTLLTLSGIFILCVGLFFLYVKYTTVHKTPKEIEAGAKATLFEIAAFSNSYESLLFYVIVGAGLIFLSEKLKKTKI